MGARCRFVHKYTFVRTYVHTGDRGENKNQNCHIAVIRYSHYECRIKIDSLPMLRMLQQ